MIDKWDIEKFEWFLRLARTEGTDVIKIVAAEKPNTWLVSVFPEKGRLAQKRR